MSENLRETNAAKENRTPELSPAVPTLMVVLVTREAENGVLSTRGMRRATADDARAFLDRSGAL